ncbi:AsnC family protein [Salmonella enterica]|nr:AsnC family protein [Salmonella enterica]
MILKPMRTPGKCPACERAWTPEEDELLISLHPSMTYKKMTAHLNRSERGIRARASIFIHAGILAAKTKPFTPDQDAFIRANRHRLTLYEVAIHLGKSKDCVSKRAQRLGVSYRKAGDLHHATKHPDSDVDLIHALRDEGLTFRCIAKKFEIPHTTARSLYYDRKTAIDAIAREYLPR